MHHSLVCYCMAKFGLQKNGLMISTGEEEPALLSLTCQFIQNSFSKNSEHSKLNSFAPRPSNLRLHCGGCGRGGSLLFLDDRVT